MTAFEIKEYLLVDGSLEFRIELNGKVLMKGKDRVQLIREFRNTKLK